MPLAGRVEPLQARRGHQEPALAAAPQAPGTQFNKKNFGLSFDLKNSLRFHFDSDTCLNYRLNDFFL